MDDVTLGFLVFVAPLLAVAVSLFSIYISIKTQREVKRAVLTAAWGTGPAGEMRFLIIKNSGHGPATLLNVRMLENGKPIGMTYVKDRDCFPVEIGTGDSVEFQIDKRQSHPHSVLVALEDSLGKHERRLFVSTRRVSG